MVVENVNPRLISKVEISVNKHNKIIILTQLRMWMI